MGNFKNQEFNAEFQQEEDKEIPFWKILKAFPVLQ